MNNENIEKLHVSLPDFADALPTRTAPEHETSNATPQSDLVRQRPSQLAAIRRLIAPAIRMRKLRSHSFAAKLTPDQRATLFDWLQSDTIEEVRARLAAPAPDGFGIQVSPTSLVRLKRTINNTQLNHIISHAMDATCDILDADTSVDIAPLREALSLLLYSQAFNHSSAESICPQSIDRLLSAIARLEKLKSNNPRAPRPSRSRPFTTHHKVDLSVTARPAHQPKREDAG